MADPIGSSWASACVSWKFGFASACGKRPRARLAHCLRAPLSFDSFAARSCAAPEQEARAPTNEVHPMRHTQRAWKRFDSSLLSLRAAQALSLGALVLLSDCGASDGEPPPRVFRGAGAVQPETGGETPAPAPTTDPPPVSAPTTGEGVGEVPLVMPDPPVTPPAMNPPAMNPPAMEPPVPEPPCVPLTNTGSPTDGDINVNLATELQTITGFGGMNMPRWIGDLTAPQRDTAFQTGAGQLGLSML